MIINAQFTATRQTFSIRKSSISSPQHITFGSPGDYYVTAFAYKVSTPDDVSIDVDQSATTVNSYTRETMLKPIWSVHVTEGGQKFVIAGKESVITPGTPIMHIFVFGYRSDVTITDS